MAQQTAFSLTPKELESECLNTCKCPLRSLAMEFINTAILYVMMFFMLVGGLGRVIRQWDRCEHWLGKRLFTILINAGDEFEKGFMTMGPLSLAMVGIIALAPILAHVVGPVLIPLYHAMGASPAMFATTLLANDMGGFFLAKQLAETDGVLDHAAWLYAGLILGAMLGPTLVFTVPVALGIIPFKDRPFLALGVLAGIITIPLGCIAGGVVAMHSQVIVHEVPVTFSYSLIFVNLIPIILISLLIVVGLWMIPQKMIAGFQVLAKIVVCIATVGLCVAVLESVLKIPLIPGMDPLFMAPGDQPGQVLRAIEVVGYIACILLGAYPMVFLLTLWLKKPLKSWGALLQMNRYAAAGMVATLANNIPMFGLFPKMDDRGKVLNVAFSVSAAFTFGDHLGFTIANVPGMILAVIVGKLIGGITAVWIAILILRKSSPQLV